MAKKAWKDLEGQYFRLDVGSTEAEALASEESNVLFITTEQSMVMNGEVVGRGKTSGDSSGSSSGGSSSAEEESYVRCMVTGGFLPRTSNMTSSAYKCYISADDKRYDVEPGFYGVIKVASDKTFGLTNPLGEISAIDVSHWHPKSLVWLSSGFLNIRFIEELDLSHIDVSNVVSFTRTFFGMSNLKRLNISTWDTSKGVQFNSMFMQCAALEVLNLTSFNMSSVGSDSQMLNLSGNQSLKTLFLGRDFFNSPKVTSVTLNLPNWTDSSVNSSLNIMLYDRASNSQPTLNLKLSDETKAVLSDTAKTQLEKYGYTLA